MKKTAASWKFRGDLNSPWLSPQQAADYFGVSVDTIYRACASGALRHSKLGHSTIRIRRDWLDLWAVSRAP